MLQNKEKIQHKGVICEVKSDCVFVRIEQKAACADCHAKNLCNISESKEKIIEIPVISEKHKVGDVVIITGAFSMGLKAVLFAFVIPLILMLASLVWAVYLTGSELLGALLAVLSLVIYYYGLYLFRDILKDKFVFRLAEKL